MFKYHQIAQLLIEEMTANPHLAQLPPRDQLCQRFQVTRTTINHAIDELTEQGYLHSVRGSGTFINRLATGGDSIIQKNNSWGVIVPTVAEGPYGEILRGITDTAQKNGCQTIICNNDYSPQLELERVKSLVQSGVKGIIMVPVNFEPSLEEAFVYMEQHHVPYVFCNRGVSLREGTPLVAPDYYYGGYIATKHLINMGYKKIAFLVKRRYSVMIERYKGYLAAVMEAGLDLNKQHIIFGYPTDDQPDGYTAFRRLFQQENPPDSIFCGYEHLVTNLYAALDDLGLRVSEDVGVITLDSSSLCEVIKPALTAMSSHSIEVGAQAGKILCKLIDGHYKDDSGLYIFHPTLEVRNSCLGPQRIK